MSDLENYVRQHLSFELKEVRIKHKASSLLNVFEETIIFKYSEDGYEDLSQLLRKKKGTVNPEFGKFLRTVLLKLPHYSGIVYRGVNLTSTEFNQYKKHFNAGKSLMEYAFISSSRSRLIAMAFGANYLFRIWSKRGKSIEEYTKFGVGNPQNEQEVLFLSNSRFNVTEIKQEPAFTLITMFEV